MLDGVLAWLTSLPPATLYVALALIAAAENIFPPLPADTIVAFGAFLAARGDASLLGAFLSTWLGNVGGALLMYAAGRYLGGERLARRFPALGKGNGGAARVSGLYARYGVPALFVSRFLPAARALVPPVAGAMRVPVLTAALAMALASAAWYGAIAVLAYNVGERWDLLSSRIADVGRWAGIGALGLAVVGAGVWLLRRRR